MQFACAILSSVACSVLQHFCALSHKGREIQKQIEIRMCSDFLYSFLAEIFLILRRTERYIIKNLYCGLRVKYPLFLSYFNETWIFWQTLKNNRILNFMKIRPLRVEVFRWQMDRQTDMKRLIVAFRNFAKTPKIWTVVLTYQAK